MSEVERLTNFACRCGDKAPNMEALRAEVCEALKCEPDRLVTAVVQALNDDFDVRITGIPTDMWSAVKSERRRRVTEDEWNQLPEDASDYDEWVVEADAFIQCDRVEDGFALTWKTWVEWWEKR